MAAPLDYTMEAPASLKLRGGLQVNKFEIPSFEKAMYLEPSDRHGYSAYWTKDLNARAVGGMPSGLKNLTDFVRKYNVPMFKDDAGFTVLRHVFLMLGRESTSGKNTNHR